MTPKYRETYVVSVAFVDQFPEPAQVLAKQLQQAYEGDVAGWFNWERLGRVTVLHFGRLINEDEEVLSYKNQEMTPETVVAQLVLELVEARDQIPDEENNDHYNQLTVIINALKAGDEVKVAGLPCQAPSMQVVVTVAFETETERDISKGNLDIAVKGMASVLQGDLIDYKVESLLP